MRKVNCFLFMTCVFSEQRPPVNLLNFLAENKVIFDCLYHHEHLPLSDHVCVIKDDLQVGLHNALQCECLKCSIYIHKLSH